jgi:hypothetical protein
MRREAPPNAAAPEISAVPPLDTLVCWVPAFGMPGAPICRGEPRARAGRDKVRRLGSGWQARQREGSGRKKMGAQTRKKSDCQSRSRAAFLEHLVAGPARTLAHDLRRQAVDRRANEYFGIGCNHGSRGILAELILTHVSPETRHFTSGRSTSLEATVPVGPRRRLKQCRCALGNIVTE